MPSVNIIQRYLAGDRDYSQLGELVENSAGVSGVPPGLSIQQPDVVQRQAGGAQGEGGWGQAEDEGHQDSDGVSP